jgi:hypothetical protein
MNEESYLSTRRGFIIQAAGLGAVLSLVRVDTARAAADRTSFQSLNYPDRYIRHRNFLGELTTVASDLDRQDSTFFYVQGLADPNLMSFQSVNVAGHYLRHQDLRMKLHRAPTGSIVQPGQEPVPESAEQTLMRKDATFIRRGGLAGSGASFECFNIPGHFLRHSGFHLVIAPIHTDVDRKDATFRMIPGLAPAAPGSVIK